MIGTTGTRRSWLAGTGVRNYGGGTMVAGENESDPEHPTAELRLGAEGFPDAADAAARAQIERACAGDAAAVSQLVRELLPTLRTVIRARLATAGSGDVARPVDDFVQDVFLQLFANDGQVLRRWDADRGLPLARFVALIADRFVLSELRARRASDQAMPIEDYADTLPDNAEEPERWFQSRQALLLMFDAMSARLSPLGRRLFRLLFVEELSIEEICSDTGMGADAVYAWRSRLRRKAAQLRHLIDASNVAGAL